MRRCRLVVAALLGIMGATGCARPPRDPTAAYVAALQSVRPDVVGDPAAGPLYLVPQLLPSDSGTVPHQALDSTVIRELLAQGLVQAPCSRGGGATTFPCSPARGLYVAVSDLERTAKDRYGLVVHVAGRAAPGDNTVIVGSGYWVRLTLEHRDGAWVVSAKTHTSPLMSAS